MASDRGRLIRLQADGVEYLVILRLSGVDDVEQILSVGGTLTEAIADARAVLTTALTELETLEAIDTRRRR